MPSYDYHCPSCGKHFEAYHPISASWPDCPSCGASAQRVMRSAPAIHGHMARGREAAVHSIEQQASRNAHGPGCPCCHSQG